MSVATLEAAAATAAAAAAVVEEGPWKELLRTSKNEKFEISRISISKESLTNEVCELKEYP